MEQYSRNILYSLQSTGTFRCVSFQPSQFPRDGVQGSGWSLMTDSDCPLNMGRINGPSGRWLVPFQSQPPQIGPGYEKLWTTVYFENVTREWNGLFPIDTLQIPRGHYIESSTLSINYPNWPLPIVDRITQPEHVVFLFRLRTLGPGLRPPDSPEKWALNYDMEPDDISAMSEYRRDFKERFNERKVTPLPPFPGELQLILRFNLIRKCSICLEDITHPDELIRLRCGHEFHFFCLFEWLAIRCTCPYCRRPVFFGPR